MNNIKNEAIFVSEGKFSIKKTPFPEANSGQVIIKVNAVSLNRGEVRTAFSKKEEWIPGWDLAGTIISEAKDGSGPKEQQRVVGFLPNGAWAKYVAVPSSSVAALPDNVSDSHAATLPVAGLTALHTLSKGGMLLGKRILITGATGGVGMFAVQLAAISGAYVTAVTRSKKDEKLLTSLGADEVIHSVENNKEPYDLILDSVGGDLIRALITVVKPHGTLVSFGNSSEQPDASYTVTSMYRSSVTLYGFILFNELKGESASIGLAKLAAMISRHKLTPVIEKEADWKDIQQVANDLIDRKFKGKAVLHISY